MHPAYSVSRRSPHTSPACNLVRSSGASAARHKLQIPVCQYNTVITLGISVDFFRTNWSLKLKFVLDDFTTEHICVCRVCIHFRSPGSSPLWGDQESVIRAVCATPLPKTLTQSPSLAKRLIPKITVLSTNRHFPFEASLPESGFGDCTTLGPELFLGIEVLLEPATGYHIVNRETPIAPLGQPQLSQSESLSQTISQTFLSVSLVWSHCVFRIKDAEKRDVSNLNGARGEFNFREFLKRGERLGGRKRSRQLTQGGERKLWREKAAG